MGSNNKNRYHGVNNTETIALRKNIKSLIKDISGILPYEKSILNFLKIGKEKKKPLNSPKNVLEISNEQKTKLIFLII